MKENPHYISTGHILTTMKRYIEIKEIQANFFVCYFLYSKVKYGSKGYSDQRVGRMTAYKSIMKIYGKYAVTDQRILSEWVLQDFTYLRDITLCKPDDDFRKAFLVAFEELDLHRCL